MAQALAVLVVAVVSRRFAVDGDGEAGRNVHAALDIDGAALADDSRGARCGVSRGAAQCGFGTRRVTQHVRCIDVDALLVEFAGGRHRVVTAEHEAREVQAVDAKVKHRAATERGVVEPVLAIDGCFETEVGFDVRDFAERLRSEHFTERHIDRQEAAPDRLHHEATLAARSGDHRLRLELIQREGFFAQHMLAGAQVQLRVVTVARVWCGDVHNVDIWVGSERLVRAVPARNSALRGELFGGRLAARAHGDHLRIGNLPESVDEVTRDTTRAGDTPAILHLPSLAEHGA